MKTSIKISIITVSYNVVRTIEQTIQSIVNQTYDNIEYIIIDGGSTDGTVDIIKKYEDKIANWVSEPDNGIYDAMNKGIDMATGEYIYFIGADDSLVDKYTIQNISRYFFKADVIWGTVWNLYEEYKLQKQAKNFFCLNDIYNGYHIPHQGMFVKTSLMKLYKFDVQYQIVADYAFFLQLFFDKKITKLNVDEIVAYYSYTKGRSGNIRIKVKEDCRVMRANNFSKWKIYKYQINQYFGIFVFKNIIKMFLKNIGALKLILLKTGWSIHKCNWEKCRWCNSERK
ncbi:glycosyltransferase family 2 protein [Pectinatus frisingensis]|uniref:glycosyltransferase family 2 protein n=1 Tax=Pectinatus frisingensis TaxID=865 RepID=UPI0015F5BC0B|nr:glycosyltransferase family 2 protein [Pectinatus frisingensis]